MLRGKETINIVSICIIYIKMHKSQITSVLQKCKTRLPVGK